VIVDTSAVVAILKDEPDREAMLDAILSAETRRMSAANYLETAIVVDGLNDPVKSRRLDQILATLGVEITEVTVQHAQIARRAYADFGKGSRHPAGLNFGDVFAYALAIETREPLLFKGDDFSHTDVRPFKT
jgi:ribonuclease VapC